MTFQTLWIKSVRMIKDTDTVLSSTFLVARKQLNDEDMKEIEEKVAGLQEEIKKNMEQDEEIDDEVEFMIQNMLTVS